MLKNTKLIGLLSLTACFLSVGIAPPVLSQSQEYPTQIAVDGLVKWELKSCTRKQNNIVSCSFSLNSSGDLQYALSVNGVNKIVDAGGNEYYASKTQIGKRLAGSNNQLTFEMAKNANYPTTIDFAEVPVSVSQITLLQIGTSSSVVKFRNLPIINLDGSIPTVPHSDRSPVNTQPTNTDNPTPRRKTCLPIVGCF